MEFHTDVSYLVGGLVGLPLLLVAIREPDRMSDDFHRTRRHVHLAWVVDIDQPLVLQFFPEVAGNLGL